MGPSVISFLFFAFVLFMLLSPFFLSDISQFNNPICDSNLFLNLNFFLVFKIIKKEFYESKKE